MVCFSPAFLACPTQGCLPWLTCSCELASAGLGTALLGSLRVPRSRERKWLESKRLGLCLVCLRQDLCGLPKRVEGMKDHVLAYKETMLSSFMNTMRVNASSLGHQGGPGVPRGG